jgi:hypothetical protein
MLLIRPLTAKEQKGYTHTMNRIPPSQKIGKKAEELFKQGLDGEADVTSLVIRLGIERLMQELMEHDPNATPPSYSIKCQSPVLAIRVIS